MMTSEKPEEIIYKFFLNNNRPYGFNDLLTKLPQNLTKSHIQKSLDSLVKHSKLNEKLHGKQKIYNLIYKKYESNELLENELRNVNRENFRLNEEFKTKENELKKLESEIKVLKSSMTADEAKLKIENLENFLKKQNEELKRLKSEINQNGDSLKDNENQNSIEEKYNKYVTDYKKRKRICTELIESIMEGYPKSKKHLLSELEIETDEDAGFKLNT